MLLAAVHRPRRRGKEGNVGELCSHSSLDEGAVRKRARPRHVFEILLLGVIIQ